MVSVSSRGTERLGLAQAPPLRMGSSEGVTTTFRPRLSWTRRLRLDELRDEAWKVSKRFAIFFFGFATIGYLMIELIPTTWITTYMGDNSLGSVVLAATLAIPVYVNSDASLALVSALMDGGMGPGAAMAFLVTGAGTSIGAISGMLLIARWRVVFVVVSTLFLGALALGMITNALST